MTTSSKSPTTERTGVGVTQAIDVEKAMSEPLKTACRDNPHLFDYISSLSISEIGMPEYVPELSRKMGDNKQPNIIYPVKYKGVFVHILANKDDVRNQYIPIEPSTT